MKLENSFEWISTIDTDYDREMVVILAEQLEVESGYIAPIAPSTTVRLPNPYITYSRQNTHCYRIISSLYPFYSYLSIHFTSFSVSMDKRTILAVSCKSTSPISYLLIVHTYIHISKLLLPDSGTSTSTSTESAPGPASLGPCSLRVDKLAGQYWQGRQTASTAAQHIYNYPRGVKAQS